MESLLTRLKRMRSAATAFGVLLACLVASGEAWAGTIAYHFDGNDPPVVKLQTAGIDFAGFRVNSGGALVAKVMGPGVLRLLVFADCARDTCPPSVRLMISVDGYGKLHELTPQFEPEARYVPAVPLVPSAPMPVLLKLDPGEHTFQARMPGGFAGSAVLSFSNAKRVTGADDLDLGLDLALPPPEPAPVAAKPAPKPAIAALDLDLDLPAAPPTKSAVKPAKAGAKPAVAALDLDLDLPAAPPAKGAGAAKKQAQANLDLDLDLPPAPPAKPAKTASKGASADLDLDLDLPASPPPAPAAKPAPAAPPKTVITVKRTDGPNAASPRPAPAPVIPVPAAPPPMSLLIPMDDEPEPPAPKPAAKPEPKPAPPAVAAVEPPKPPAPPKPPEPELPPPELGRVELGLRGGWNWSRDRLEGQGEAVLELSVRLPQPTLRIVLSGGTTLLRGTWVAFEPGRGRGDFVQNTLLVPVNLGLTWEPTGKGGISPFVGLSFASGYAETTLTRLSLSPVVVKGLMLGGSASVGVRLQAGRGSFVFMGEHSEAVATLATLSKLGQSVVSRTSVTGGFLFSF